MFTQNSVQTGALYLFRSFEALLSSTPNTEEAKLSDSKVLPAREGPAEASRTSSIDMILFLTDFLLCLISWHFQLQFLIHSEVCVYRYRYINVKSIRFLNFSSWLFQSSGVWKGSRGSELSILEVPLWSLCHEPFEKEAYENNQEKIAAFLLEQPRLLRCSSSCSVQWLLT